MTGIRAANRCHNHLGESMTLMGDNQQGADAIAYPTTDALMAEASAAAGLSDFGAPTFREGLDRLLQSLREDADLTQAGWAGVKPMLLRRLTNRLQIEDWYRSHPEAEQAPVDGPVSIMGLERTGTTALANMMSLDPQFRSLRSWEQGQPCPPPTLEGEMRDPRRLDALARIKALIAARPEQKAMHLYDIDATVEDHDLLGLEFRAQQTIIPIFGYHAWWRDADMWAAYRYHRRVTALLQSSRPPNRWLFKAPHHRFHLEAFLDAYPDTRFVFTHRDPAKVSPSFASFAASLYPAGAAERHDMRRVGRLIHEHMLIGVQRAMEARARIGEHRFIDVHQHQIDRDPIGTLECIYAFLDLELRPEMRAAVTRWVEANHNGAHGRHRYSAEQFGLTKEGIRSDYDFYIRHFGVRIED